MTFDELKRLYEMPLFQLIQRARGVYLEHWKVDQIQLCTLLSIKTGGCPEDCGYCSQSARHAGRVKAEALMSKDAIVAKAREAVESGSSRFCMGTAWRGVREGDPRFAEILEIIRAVSALGLEVCVTLGQLTFAEARKLKDAGLTAYNHNIDTSPQHYPKVTTTHTFQDRLETIAAVQEAGLAVCCGGILGLGESEDDRLRMLEVLTNFSPAPESVPINCLMPQPGTPMEHQPPVDVFELIRMVAVTRIALPRAKVRLSAGRSALSREAQAFCFYAGANSIFFGDRLLTSKNPGACEDRELLKTLDLAG